MGPFAARATTAAAAAVVAAVSPAVVGPPFLMVGDAAAAAAAASGGGGGCGDKVGPLAEWLGLSVTVGGAPTVKPAVSPAGRTQLAALAVLILRAMTEAGGGEPSELAVAARGGEGGG